MGQNDVTQKDMDWLEMLTQTKKTLTELHGEDVSKRVIAMGVKDKNLTDNDLRAIANKELTERQTEMEKDFLTTGSAIDKGDTTLTSETFDNKYLHPDSIPNYSRSELNFAHSRKNTLEKQELAKLREQYTKDATEMNVEKKEIKLINEKLLNLEDVSDFQKDMNIGIFDELGRLIRKPLNTTESAVEREESVASTGLGALYEGGSDITDIVKAATPGLDVERKEVEREEGESTEDWLKRQGESREDWSKRQKEPTEQYQKDLPEYEKNYKTLNELEDDIKNMIFTIGNMAGFRDVGIQKDVKTNLLEEQGSFLKKLDKLIVSIKPPTRHKVEFYEGEPVWSDQKESQEEANARLYVELRDKFQKYLGQLNQKHEQALGEVDKNPWLKYRVD